MIQKKRVIALGFFDGIHIGHAALMRRVKNVGNETGLIPSVITFDAHPLSLVSDEAVSLINSPEDRAGLIRRVFGINDIIFLHFDRATVLMPWDKFIDHLVEEFGARHLVAGNDFRFGNGGKGNSKLLVEKCNELGIGCDIVPDVIHDGVVSSSTYIRELLTSGDLERANEFLGHPHVLTDIVRYGYRLGRTLGTPTINMRFSDGVLVPAFGVYATKVFLEDDNPDADTDEVTGMADGHIGVTNIGIRPTVDSSGHITAETHILDFQRNLYGHQVRLEFYKRLRPEKKFNDINELKAQIQKDCANAFEFLTNLT
jgi:riboflavin kinase/FMN adenylyltransferase